MAERDCDKQLFGAEEQVLQGAMADLAAEQYRGNSLLERYRLLTGQYDRLLKLTRKVFRISDMQGKALQRSQREMQNLLDNANQGFLTFGADLRIQPQYSAECERLFGRKIAGLLIIELLSERTPFGNEMLEQIFQRFFITQDSAKMQESLAYFPFLLEREQQTIRVECKYLASSDAEEAATVMLILTDVTEEVAAQQKISFLSYHDKLTNLYNRAYIEEALPELEKSEALPVSIIVIDMNGLKLANDVFGHQEGDNLLLAMADLLRSLCRPRDIIARWGGDEFLLLLPQTGEMACAHLCQSIREGCLAINHCVVPLSAAVGAATKETPLGQIIELFNVAESRMYSDKVQRGQTVRKKMVATLEARLYERCFENQGHNERVGEQVVSFARFLNFSSRSEAVKQLKLLARLHDIGKVAIPSEILGKPSALSKSEWAIVKVHSDVGYRMAQSIGETAVADLILSLHERWDGAGYPYGLKGEEIPLLDRIFSLVDVFDIMTHDRPYQMALSKQEAILQIAAAGGQQFDPLLTEKFLAFLAVKGDQQSNSHSNF
ncbi:MAG: diguanylate cyclase [Sporomusaceae bacterium]|nr:diguanylate cyclase [Sporomusaceae bacterium]